MYLYVGTSSWMACHVPFKKTDLFHNLASLPSAIPDRYIICNEQQSAGACIEYLREKLVFPEDDLAKLAPMQTTELQEIYPALEKLAASAPAGSDGLIFLPWLYGERTPVDDRYVRGGFFNLSLTSRRAHLVRAVYEGVAMNSRWLFGYMEKFIKQQVPEVRITGGGAMSDFWCQVFADVLGRPVEQIQAPRLVNCGGRHRGGGDGVWF
jgi:xylulokinase